jgi:hypothetical protein
LNQKRESGPSEENILKESSNEKQGQLKEYFETKRIAESA